MAQEFTEYVRGPLRKELQSASDFNISASYALLTAISPFRGHLLEIVFSAFRVI